MIHDKDAAHTQMNELLNHMRTQTAYSDNTNNETPEGSMALASQDAQLTIEPISDNSR